MKPSISWLVPIVVAALAPALHADTVRELRGVWASSLGPAIDTPEQVADLVRAVRKAGLNTMVIQVRRNGAVHYRSDIEPRAPALVKYAGEHPDGDFDPLATALRLAHDTSSGQRIDVYAWFNVYPMRKLDGLSGDDPPHPAAVHPDWFTRDAEGNERPFLDPAIPGVQDHMAQLVEECIQRYAVDGINLDFVRYPEEGGGYHPIAIQRFQRLTGRNDVPADRDPAWADFRRDQVTHLVRRLAAVVRRTRPDCLLTVDAVGFGPPGERFAESAPYIQVFQDWEGWTLAGLVDVCCRMGYKREHVPAHAQQFRDWADFSRQLQAKSGRQVTLGIGGFFNQPDAALTQYREALRRGLGTCLFSYHRPTAETEATGEFGPSSPFWETLRREIYPEDALPPRPVWRKGRGTIAGFLRDADGRPIDGAAVLVTPGGFRAATDACGFYALLDLAPGTYRVAIPALAYVTANVEVEPDQVATPKF